MKQYIYLNKDKLVNLHNNETCNNKILRAIDRIIEIIIDPEKLQKKIQDQQVKESILSTYSSICILLSETRELLSPQIDVDDLTYRYMLLIRELLQTNIHALPMSLFGGLVEVAIAINALYKTTSHYKKFIDTLNEFIIKTSRENMKSYKSDFMNLKIRHYDTISGLTGVVGYLMLYKEDDEVCRFIKEVLEYLISLTDDRIVEGHVVPSYYISPRNYVADNEKLYKDGYFNFGLSHGISGPLTILSIALLEGIEIKGQKEAVAKILKDLHTFHFKAENDGIYWPGAVGLDDYNKKIISNNMSRASWCYGTPGMARSMYLAGKAIEDQTTLHLAMEAILSLCNMDIEDWRLSSPTICHGYSGIIAVMESMYEDDNNEDFKVAIKKATDAVLNYYQEDLLFVFPNIETKMTYEGKYRYFQENSFSLISGSIGVILALLSTIKPVRTNWMRQFLLK